MTPEYDTSGALIGLRAHSSLYSVDALAVIVATWERAQAAAERRREVLHTIVTCDRSTLCEECAALAREESRP